NLEMAISSMSSSFKKHNTMVRDHGQYIKWISCTGGRPLDAPLIRIFCESVRISTIRVGALQGQANSPGLRTAFPHVEAVRIPLIADNTMSGSPEIVWATRLPVG